MSRRVLITGSRDWTDGDLIWAILWLEESRSAGAGGLVVVHGAAVGADSFAAQWVREIDQLRPLSAAWYDVSAEVHPAEWKYSGRGAGLLRNQAMVDLGADICYAFIRNGSRGATDCATRAEAAGIRTIRVCV